MPPDAAPQGAEAHYRALESLYAAAPINRLFESTLSIPSAGHARIDFLAADREVHLVDASRPGDDAVLD